ncbi:MAG: substrate-binding domain-containing protein [Gammaproteobacteria bacterium]|nr:substrate-binding domain-containing protein [Gammaproteobacteria bacterium]
MKERSFIVPVIAFWMLFTAASATAESRSIRVASATTIENSGLYDAILPVFRAQTGIHVHVQSVGTGHAIAMARSGDADVLLGHHKASEQQFVQDGFGVKRFDLMYNDFVLVGAPDDPAGARNTRDIHEAFERIAMSRSKFISRADDSGTHLKEQSIWQDLSTDVSTDSGSWYLETGGSMGSVLSIANSVGAYTLSDRGTWLKYRNRMDLELLLDGDPTLFNQYGVVLVSPEAHPHTNTSAATEFLQWLLSDDGQSAINSYLINGKQAFFANAQWENQWKAQLEVSLNLPSIHSLGYHPIEIP